jgi:hypothetical protein
MQLAGTTETVHDDALPNGEVLLGTYGGPGYENSAACKLVATHCCVCNKPLVEALSVTSGIGPVCAKKYGAQAPQAEPNFKAACVEAAQIADLPEALVVALHAENAQKACNVATYYIAAKREGREVACLIAMIWALGFKTLAEILVENLKMPTVTLTINPDKKLLAVSKTPYLTKAQFYTYLELIKAVPGRKWNANEKQNEFPFGSADALRKALRATFKPGTVVVGSRITAL